MREIDRLPERSPGGPPPRPARGTRPGLLGRLSAFGARGAFLALGALVAVNAAVLMGNVRPRLAEMRDAVTRARAEARDARSDLAETQAELERVRAIQSYSETYQIPADLAASIHDQARAEDLDADLAFRLVQVESGFRQRAVSDVGAVGYTQLLPSTAEWLEPGISKESLFDRDTNLRLGFRYLRTLLDAYDGDPRLALLAYNRGPGVVRSIVAAGGDPANGFARQVLGTAE